MNNTRLGTVIILFLFAATANSAEIRLRSEVLCTATLVTLSDIADIFPAPGGDAIQLGNTVLTTAPAVGETKTLSAVEIRDILSRSGVSSLRNRLTGASRVSIVSEGASFTERGPLERNSQDRFQDHHIVPASYTQVTHRTLTPSGTASRQNNVQTAAIRSNSSRKMPIPVTLLRTLEQQISEAICVYLDYKQSTETGQTTRLPWKGTVKLSQEQARLLASGGQIVDIVDHTNRAANASTGRRRFGIRMQATDETTGQNIVVTIDADVILPREVVVPRRSLPKGFIIGADDVVLRRVENLDNEEFFIDASEVIGHETVRAIDEATALTPSMLRRPLWVKKGDIVTIRAKNGGVTVRTEVVALADGCDGDTIPVETIDPNRSKRSRNHTADTTSFLARVSGPKNVEVFATGNVIGD